jgi:hypothetical protein
MNHDGAATATAATAGWRSGRALHHIIDCVDQLLVHDLDVGIDQHLHDFDVDGLCSTNGRGVFDAVNFDFGGGGVQHYLHGVGRVDNRRIPGIH